MIYGIGVDLVRIARVENALARHGDRFADRVLHHDEVVAFRATARRAALLAKHFAAKEALLKALGTGLRFGIRWHDMAVYRDGLGKPYFRCAGRVRELLDEAGVDACHLSLTDEREYAVAFVTLAASKAP
jgi:holo-[acyl-carrier protein] synthase